MKNFCHWLNYWFSGKHVVLTRTLTKWRLIVTEFIPSFCGKWIIFSTVSTRLQNVNKNIKKRSSKPYHLFYWCDKENKCVLYPSFILISNAENHCYRMLSVMFSGCSKCINDCRYYQKRCARLGLLMESICEFGLFWFFLNFFLHSECKRITFKSKDGLSVKHRGFPGQEIVCRLSRL